MTLKELKDWTKSAKYVDSITDYDSNGNCYRQSIYLKDGQYYSVEYCNEFPYGKGGDFNPRKVIKKVEIVEQIDWVFEEE